MIRVTFIIKCVIYLQLLKVRRRLQKKKLLVWGNFIYWSICATFESGFTGKYCYYRTKLKVLPVMEIYKSEQHSRRDTSDSWEPFVFDYCEIHRNIYFSQMIKKILLHLPNK